MVKTARKSKNKKELEVPVTFKGKLYGVREQGNFKNYAINVPESELSNFSKIREAKLFNDESFEKLVHFKEQEYEGETYESYSVYGSGKEDLPTQVEYEFTGKIVQVSSPKHDTPGVFLNNLTATPVETDTEATASSSPSAKW